MRTLLTLVLTLFITPQIIFPTHRSQYGGAPPSCTPFTDNFTRANGPLGVNWNSFGSTGISIISNSASIPGFSSGGNESWINPCSLGSSYYTQFTPTIPVGNNDIFGGVILGIDSLNYVYITCTVTGGCTLVEVVAGTPSNFNSFTASPISGQTLCLELDANTHAKLKLNGVYDVTTITLAGGLTGGNPGIYLGNQDASPATLNNYQAAAGTCP